MSLALDIDEGHGPPVVLLHGFPETPSSWRHQVGPLVAAGYRVLAPWLRGYGPSPAPTDPGDYTADHLADDVAGVIEAAGAERGIVVGHDWGAACTWATAALRPERVTAMAALSVPYTSRSKQPPLARLAETFGDNFFYMLYFNEPGRRADRDLAADVGDFLTAMYVSLSGQPPEGSFRPLKSGATLREQLALPATWPDWLDRDDLAGATAAFTASGFTGPLNFYRAMDLTWERVPAFGTAPVTAPAMFLAGDRDLVLGFMPTRSMSPPLVTDLRADIRVAGAGHWVQQEAPDTVTAALLSFLAEVAPSVR